MLQCVTVCCSVLHCVAVCCSVLQCFILYVGTMMLTTGGSDYRIMAWQVFAYCSVLLCFAVSCCVLQCVVMPCFALFLQNSLATCVLQHATGCCRVLQGAAGCCRVLQGGTFLSPHNSLAMYVLQCVAHVAACCSVLQRGDLLFSLRNSLAMRTRVCTRMCMRVRVHTCTLSLNQR